MNRSTLLYSEDSRQGLTCTPFVVAPSRLPSARTKSTWEAQDRVLYASIRDVRRWGIENCSVIIIWWGGTGVSRVG